MSIGISIIALTFSLLVFFHSRWVNKRDILMRLHDEFLTRDKQVGRRLIYEMAEQQRSIDDLSFEEHVLINNTLASLNLLGIYYHRRYVRRADVLELWAMPLARIITAAQPFLEHRDRHQQAPIWPHLRSMCQDAERYVQRQQLEFRRPGAQS
ncbi:hypothetical protein [Actinomadura rudentiformis]|uniref:DUF4760 domain-containing protein n=1 Tax=Actinomadura rudentiformis TaxID=359158 RepID=A0A6H9YL58_9ACTN|nr:hypothetical protein [Actinomadura rudentiformis]KAB2347239.1 hypothetical protein F8566_19635 [Actinomadura rudentiformis]